MRARLRDGAVRSRAIEDAKMSWWDGQEGPWRWDRFFISAAPAGAKDLIGRSISEVASAENTSGEEFAFRLLEEYENDVHVVLHYREETDVVAFIKDDLAIIGSDGLALPVKDDGNRPHPRSFGSFPRVLARFVRDQKVIELADAIKKMTAAPAERLRLRDRGRLEPNYHADVILIDTDKVTDRSTFAQPYALAEGVDTVIVNGSIVLDERKLTGARPGKLLRRTY
jgi:N-acyl-D-aspartate/D-glutamate deacylase